MKNRRFRFSALPYNHRVAVVIFLFVLIPCIFLAGLYLKTSYPQWVQHALSSYQDDVNTSALLTSNALHELSSKMEYIQKDTTVRSEISKVNKMTLYDALELISTLNQTANSVTTGSQDLKARWYPYGARRSYGQYCYTLGDFCSEFPDGAENEAYQQILTLSEQRNMWMIRDISRDINNAGTRQRRLCLYSQLTNLGYSNCVVELSLPIADLFEQQTAAAVSGGVYAIFFGQTHSNLITVLDSVLDDQTAQSLILQYHQLGSLSQYYVFRAPIPNTTDGEVLFLLPNSFVWKEVAPQIVTFALIVLCFLAMVLCASYLTSHLLTKRVMHTLNTIGNDLEKLSYAPEAIAEHTGDGIDKISHRVQSLVRDAQEYSAKIEHYEAERLRTKLELLQMQFNPHFLYNTLGSIRCLSRSQEVRSAIDSLCHYYRIVLSNGHLMVNMQSEFDMIREYLRIEKFTYRLEQVAFSLELDDAVADCTIIKHLLQPIVENALTHGLRPAGRPGLLTVCARADAEDILISITDNGVGMSPEAARELLAPPARDQHGGYGIYNAQQRIHVYYGQQYNIHIHSIPGEGTTVTVRIPQKPDR